MDEFSFLQHLKKTALECLDGLYSMFCTGLVVLYILLHQSKAQCDAINIIANSGDWYLFIPMLIGLFAIGFVIRYIITGIFKLINYLFKLLMKKK